MRLSVFVIIGAVLSVTICQIRLEKTYLFHKSSKANWFQANVFCETNNLRLVSIHSLEEHDLIVRKMADLGLKDVSWWTAGNDLAEDGVFYWGFSQKKAFTNWDKGQPDNPGGDEHCTEIWSRNGENHWNNWPCTDEKFFICEYFINSRQVGAGNLTLHANQMEVPLSLD